MSHKKKRNIIIGTLCGVLLLMVVGYAAFNSVLKIKGTSNISSNWDIKITKITSNVLHGTPSNAIEPTGVGTLTATFETNLVSPGDSMQYVITITNNSSMNATLEKITVSEPNNDAITFETSGLTEGSTLTSKGTADLTVTVTYKDIAEGQKQPDNTKGTLSVTLDYVQEGSNGGSTGGNTLTIDDLIATAVTEGDGLYEDTYELGRYVYKGANPNNYITFNNETWRIIAVESDGTLKIIRNKSIGNRAWDTNDSTTGRNNANNTYCQISSGTYYGCNAWSKVEGTWTNGSNSGIVTKDASLNTYLNDETEGADSYYNTLSSESKGLIQTHTWGIGSVTSRNTDLAAQIQSENSATWSGKIGLMSLSDYLKANINTTQCGNYSLNNSNKETCKTTNYISSLALTIGYLWTISPQASSPNRVCYVSFNNTIGDTSTNANYVPLPTLYLIPNITLSGKGTSDDPYTIVS